MNSLIIIREKHYSWLRGLGSADHPAMVTICNKPILEYMVDFIVLVGGKKIRLVFEEPDGSVEAYFGNGERWGVEIEYGNAQADDTIARVVEKNSSFGEQAPLIVIDGLLFIHYDKNARYEINPEGPGTGFLYNSESGSISYSTADAAERSTLVEITPNLQISTPRKIVNLFRITMQVLREEQHRYVIPGYGADKGVILGRNVEIGKEVKIHGPVVVGSNVRLLGSAVIGPNVVIGNNVIVDDGAEIRESLVMADTYIGRRLYISAKMVAGSKVVSVSNNASIEVSDEFLLSPLKRSLPINIVRYLINVCGAFLLALLQLIPFCIFFTLGWLKGDLRFNKSRFLLSSDGQTKIFRTPSGFRTGAIDRIIRSLSLDRFALLKEVFAGKLQLVGNRLIPDTAEGREFVKDFSGYSPGIFNYTEADRLDPGAAESEIAERFYSANRGFLTESKSLMKALMNNLLHNTQTLNQ
jgi:hypothetical protein